MKIQGIPLSELADQFGTPFYVYDGEQIRKNIKALRLSLPETVDVYYSVKANPNISVCALISQMGLGAEVCSLTELETAFRAGFPLQKMIFVGPGKKSCEIERACKLGLNAIVCESINELAQINEFAEKYSRVIDVVIRINPNFIPYDASLKMGGVPSQFGVDEQKFNKTIIANYKHIKVKGIHVYNGTRILSADTVVENTRNILMLACALSKAWEINFEFIDIGGGIGIPYFENEKMFDLCRFSQLIKPIIEKFLCQYPFTKIVIESGRYLVGNAGWFVTCIQQTKKSRSENFLVTDGGMNCHLMAAGYGTMMKRNFPLESVTRLKSDKQVKYQITGPLCTPVDVIGKNSVIAESDIGDLIVIKESGAYGPTASPVYFLGHGYPTEILIEEGVAHLIRERDSVEELLKKQRLINFKKEKSNASTVI